MKKEEITRRIIESLGITDRDYEVLSKMFDLERGPRVSKIEIDPRGTAADVKIILYCKEEQDKSKLLEELLIAENFTKFKVHACGRYATFENNGRSYYISYR